MPFILHVNRFPCHIFKLEKPVFWNFPHAISGVCPVHDSAKYLICNNRVRLCCILKKVMHNRLRFLCGISSTPETKVLWHLLQSRYNMSSHCELGQLCSPQDKGDDLFPDEKRSYVNRNSAETHMHKMYQKITSLLFFFDPILHPQLKDLASILRSITGRKF